MIFNQRQKLEIQKLIVAKEAHLKFTETDDIISLVRPRLKFIKFNIKRKNGGFEITRFHTTSNETNTINPKDFNSLKYHLTSWFKLIANDYPKIVDYKDSIDGISGNYYSVLKEAIVICNLGFEESSGMVFRKSLEILIKDYFLYLLPQFEEVILKKTIGGLIRYFYDIDGDDYTIKLRDDLNIIKLELEEIKSLCKKIQQTFQIGNDFAHYERRLEKLTSEDLHLNILKIEQFIDYHLQQEYLKDMKEFLNQEFESDETK